MFKHLYTLDLRKFDAPNPNTQTTASSGLSSGMRTYYEDRLIDLAEPKLVHDQFGDKYPIPENNGKTIEFGMYGALPKALTALTEGVTPDGGNLERTAKQATVAQYGYYITISDILELTHAEKQIEQSLNQLGPQAGRTLDTITRDVIAGGTNVMFMPKVSGNNETEVLSRKDLDKTAQLTVKGIFRAAAKLNKMNANTIDNAFVAIVHPNVACDLMTGDKWVDVHKYATPENIYNGEIGMLGGVRFVQSTEAKIVAPAVISDGKTRLTCKTAISSSTTSVVINEVLTAAAPGTPIPVYVNGVANTITAIATASNETTLTLGTAITSLAVGAVICGTGAAKGGESIYCTMIIGKGAYGVTEVKGGGLQFIVKKNGEGEDPLNQRGTAGWKAVKVAERLVEEYMVRVEHCSDTEPYADAN